MNKTAPTLRAIACGLLKQYGLDRFGRDPVEAMNWWVRHPKVQRPAGKPLRDDWNHAKQAFK